MKFKKGDLVTIIQGSRYEFQQKFDVGGKKIPFTIKDINIHGFNYTTNNELLYNDEDLEPFKLKISYEVY